MLSMLAEQGVTHAFMTPHFYATNDTPDSFFERRGIAYDALLAARSPEHPEILLGCELAYYYGVSKMSCLRDMRLAGTKLLLLEMPNDVWSDYTVSELTNLSCSSEFVVLIAHAERCIPYQSIAVRDRIWESGIIAQVNASFFLNPQTKGKAFKLMKDGRIHLLGSDCHGDQFRAPRIGEARAAIEKKLGVGVLSDLDRYSAGFLNKVI